MRKKKRRTLSRTFFVMLLQFIRSKHAHRQQKKKMLSVKSSWKYLTAFKWNLCAHTTSSCGQQFSLRNCDQNHVWIELVWMNEWKWHVGWLTQFWTHTFFQKEFVFFRQNDVCARKHLPTVKTNTIFSQIIWNENNEMHKPSDFDFMCKYWR